MDNNYYKNKLYNQLFQTRVIKVKNSTWENLGVKTVLECSEPRIVAHMDKLYKKYRHILQGKNDFNSEYLLWSWRAIERFEIRDESEGTWAQLVDGTANPALLGKLIKNIKTTTEHEIYKYVNPDAKFTRGEVDGVKGQHITLKIQIESLDNLLFSEDNTTLEDFMSDEDSIFSQNVNDEYYITYFHKWFNEHKHRIITKSQLKLLEDLDKCKKVEGYTTNDIQKYTGVPSNKINARLKRIQTRVLKTWEKEKPTMKNRLEIERDKKIELLAEFQAIVKDDSNLDTQNLRLTNWLKRTYNTTLIMDMLDEMMTLEETKATNRVFQTGVGQIPATVLYKFSNRVDREMQKLKTSDYKVVPVSKEFNTKAQERKNRELIGKNAPAYVYKDGEFQRIELTTEKKRKNNIVYILPSGLRVETSGKLED